MRLVQKVWENARKGRPEFLEEARKQFIPNLAAVEGKVPAIHKHFGDKRLEETAFRLKEGEVSGLIEMQDKSVVILFCEKHLPADNHFGFEDKRAELHKDMFDLRLAQKIPEVFAELQKQAGPQFLLPGTRQQVAQNVVPPPASAPIATPAKESAPRTQVVIPPPPVVAPVTPPSGSGPGTTLTDAPPLPAPNLTPEKK